MMSQARGRILTKIGRNFYGVRRRLYEYLPWIGDLLYRRRLLARWKPPVGWQ